MWPFRILLLSIVVVLLVVISYTVIDFFFLANNMIYESLTGEKWTWDVLPDPLGSFLREAWNVLVPHLLVLMLVMALVVEFVLMFRHTTEGYYHWR